MGKFLNQFKNKGKQVAQSSQNMARRVDNYAQQRANRPQQFRDGRLHSDNRRKFGEKVDDIDGFSEDDFNDDWEDKNFNDPYVENVQPAQKPASFHHFILENQYKDLEKSIRGYKDVFNREKNTWEIKRKAQHCFTDEEAEDILRTAQSHLATDIKLTFYNKETFGIRFLAVYEAIEKVFRRIVEYRFGRFGSYENQAQMKEQAFKIFVELITRIEANYLRAVAGMENKQTHQSVQSQESLQGRDEFYNQRDKRGEMV